MSFTLALEKAHKIGKSQNTTEVIKLKTVIVNEMASGDLTRLKKILFLDGGNPLALRNDEEYFQKNKMILLGSGHFGNVYEFIGSDGYRYAVKISRYDFDEGYKEHDGEILEKLQGIEGYNKLFCYFQGTVRSVRWGEPYDSEFVIMISKKVFGFTVNAGNSNEYCRRMFHETCKETILDNLAETIEKTFDVGYFPGDIKADNVMIDMEIGKAVIVDVGCFEKTNNDDIRPQVLKLIRRSKLDNLCSKTNAIYNEKFSLEVMNDVQLQEA